MTPGWAEPWQRSWDRLEESLVPNREWKMAGLVDLVEAVAGPEPVVVDLGCGTGTVALRVLERLPGAAVIGVDVDPVLLAIASASFLAHPRVRIVAADLRSHSRTEALPEGSVDAVVTATALHWLSEPVVRRLYRDLAGLIRPGGLFAHAEYMPLTAVPSLAAATRRLVQARLRAHDGPTWDQWWESVAADTRLGDAFSQRKQLFESTYPAEEFSPPASWHRSALVEAGFSEAGVVYRSLGGATVAAVR